MSVIPKPIENATLRPLELELRKAMIRWKDEHGGESYWRDPLVAVASATDLLWGSLCEVVDPEHALPQDLLWGAQSVIVFFVPFEQRLGEENDQSAPFASSRWATSYAATNSLIEFMNDRLTAYLRSASHRAHSTPPTHNFDKTRLVSRWSHKHLAYIAGLGTFGHHHLLITSSGCCGRLGSLVTDMPLPPTQRQNREWCLAKAGHECLLCVSKCSFGALSETHFDRHRCYTQCLKNDSHFSDLPLTDVCGKCACQLPCSYGIPKPLT